MKKLFQTLGPGFLIATSSAGERWEAQMSDILIRETEAKTGFPPLLEEVFHLD